ncbi:MAG TPA: signal recognition particle protein [Abditibacteriaceae bacterium]|jgi:signal recognition particle subunit SRP54
MLSNLSERLNKTFAKLRGKGRVSEADVDAAMREVRLALLEADVNFKIVKDFVGRVREKAVGVDVLESLSPDQQVIAIVRDELTELLGGITHRVHFASRPPTVIMLAGLQGTGKTTTCAKLAAYFKRDGKKPLMIATDIYRPGAILQLQTVGKQVGVPVFEMGTAPPPDIARAGLKYAQAHGHDVVIVDTAGRLHIDEEMMREARAVQDAIEPHETLLALDAMTGQDAVTAAQAFNETVKLTGVVLTKLDGDARGGAILSVRTVTGVPVKFVGVGEKLDALEEFHPDRMAGRILGMGDVLTLIEKAEKNYDQKQAQLAQEKMMAGNFDLEDFMEQMRQVKKMGGIESLIGMLPGASQMMKGGIPQVDEKAMGRVEAMILSMTPKERRDPDCINGSRKRRIAAGSGTSIQEINRLLGQFREMKKMIRQMSAMASGKTKMPRGFNPMKMMR